MAGKTRRKRVKTYSRVYMVKGKAVRKQVKTHLRRRRSK